MAEAAAIGEELQQQAIALLRTQQQLMRGSFQSYASELQQLRDQTNLATVEVGELNTAAQDNREVIEQAANIREDAVNIARQEAQAEVQEARNDFLDFIALSLRALGLTEADLAATANAMAMDPTARANIGRETVERFIQVSRTTNEALERVRN